MVSLLIISPVCSTDDIAGEVISSNQTIDIESVKNDDYNILNNESPQEDGNFDDLALEIESVEEGGVLTLTRNYNYINGSGEGIEIYKAITIDGKGHTLNANKQSGIFYITSDNVVLKNITFLNGYYPDGGSAIEVDGSVSIIDCYFKNNSGSYYGAVLSWQDSSLDIINTTFEDNDCTYTIEIYGEFSMEDCRLINNTGSRAMYGSPSMEEESVCTIKNTVFDSMKRQTISLGSADFNIINCEFRNINLFYRDNQYSLNVQYSNFTDSNVDIRPLNKKKFAKSSFSNCSFQNSQISCERVSLKILNSIMVNSTGESVLSSVESDLIIDKSIFMNSDCEMIGGALFFNRGNLTITDSVFENNHAYSGGALAIFSVDSLLLENNCFKNNSATLVGGAIYSAFDFGGNNTFISNHAGEFNDTYFFTQKQNISALNMASINSTFHHMDYQDLSEIPAYYNLAEEGYLTPVKNQSNSGACWSFSSIASVESGILKITGIPVDLSENNMKNLMHYYSIFGRNVAPDDGGYYYTSLGYLTSWMGPVLECEDEFDDKSVFSNHLNSSFHIQNVIFIGDMHHSDLTLIKKAIMKYGALSTSLLMLAGEENDFKQYSDSMDSPDHGVAIVGWDDEMEIPGAPEKGAWIVKNSYGSDWGYDGYFYLSYYDKTYYFQTFVEDYEMVGFDGFVYEFTDNINYEKNYQYELGLSHFYNVNMSQWYKNVFYSTDDEYLAAASTYFNRDSFWELFVYVNDELMENKTGFSKAGYHTIELDEFIPLKTGDKFEVVFKLASDGVYIPFACADDFSVDFTHENLSFISADGITWQDISNMSWKDSNFIQHYSQMACIKAFTILNPVGTALDLIVEFDGINTATLTARVLNQYGIPLNKGEVSFNIQGNLIKANVSMGIAKISTVLQGGVNNILAEFSAIGFESSTNLTSIKAKTETLLKASNVKAIYNVDKYLTITLKDTNGKAISNAGVTVNLNGAKEYVSDKNGQVKINVKKLVPKKYYVKVAFNGDEDYIKSSATVKVVVKKATPKLTAKKKTFKKSQKTKKYTVKLKTNKNKAMKKTKVTLKVNGKTYKARTNNKGIAIIKITKLMKKGKFLATIKYSGSKYYKSKKVKAKINVR